MNKLEQTTAPTESPITLAEAKTQMRVDISTDDTIIQSFIDAATDYVQEVCWSQIVTATYKYYLDEFPASGDIVLPKPPLQSVGSITYVDTDEVTQTWSSSSYEVDAKAEPGLVRPVTGESYPDTYDQLNAVTITFTSGFGAASAVPDGVKQIIYLLTAHYYDARQALLVSGASGQVNQIPVPDAIWMMCQKFNFKEL